MGSLDRLSALYKSYSTFISIGVTEAGLPRRLVEKISLNFSSKVRRLRLSASLPFTLNSHMLVQPVTECEVLSSCRVACFSSRTPYISSGNRSKVSSSASVPCVGINWEMCTNTLSGVVVEDSEFGWFDQAFLSD